MKLTCRWFGHRWRGSQYMPVNGFVLLPEGTLNFNAAAFIWECKNCMKTIVTLDDKKPAPKTLN